MTGLGAPGTAAGAGSAQEVIDLVNQLRSANGLAALKVDSALMAAAQGHSEYMAESGDVSHTGTGGSAPAGRAAAAGYSGSGVTENIMSGSGLSAAQAVSWWQSDGLHLSTMLMASAEDIGAGVAVSGDIVYYTLVVGSKGKGSGSASAAVGQPPASAGAAAASTPPTLEVVIRVEALTPGPDGSITHVVKDGQTIWDIAAAYNISLADLYALNGLTDQSVIFPEERLIIRLPDKTLTPAAQTTGVSPSSPTSETLPPGTLESISMQAGSTDSPATRTPAPPTPAPSTTAPQVSETPAETSSSSIPAAVSASTGFPLDGLDPVLAIIGLLALLGTSLMLIGIVLKRGS